MYTFLICIRQLIFLFVYLSLFYSLLEAISTGAVPSSVQTVLDPGDVCITGTGEIMLDKEKPKFWRNTCLSAILPTKNNTWIT
jgi:hypothetical protein